MADWTYIAYTKGQSEASANSLAGDVVLNLAAGDLLIAIAKWEGTSDTATFSDGGSNALTMSAALLQSDHYSSFGYKIGASANATATMTFSTVSNQTARSMLLIQITPGAGNVSLDGGPNGVGGGIDPDPVSPNITTAGASVILLGGLANSFGRSITTPLIGESAATSPIDTGRYTHMFYRVATGTNIHSQATYSANTNWGAYVVAFKLVAAGGDFTEHLHTLLKF
jgi:hypothetical protein